MQVLCRSAGTQASTSHAETTRVHAVVEVKGVQEQSKEELESLAEICYV